MKYLYIIALVFIFLFISWSVGRDRVVMETDWCFKERADGSIYRYICEK